MADFLFKNLSVKLLPGEGREPQGDRDICIDSATCDDDHTCFDKNTIGVPEAACGFCTFCTYQTCGVPSTDQIVLKASDEGGDAMEGALDAYSRRLQKAQLQIDKHKQILRSGGKPVSIDEIELLRARLVEAVAELDAHRAKLDAGKESETE
jgi:hypothetical protein